MPVLAANIPPGLFSEIHDLVKDGTYSSPEQFLETAAFNQVALERSARGEAGKRPSTLPPPAVEQPQPTPSGQRAPSTAPKKVRGPRRAVPEADLSDVLGRLTLARSGTAGRPEASPAQQRPADERVWGQVNRLLPIKVVCRWLLTANEGRSEWNEYDAVAEKLANDAATLGTALEDFDNAAGRKRDELLATGLPRRGNLASHDRFLSQIVARATRGGEIYPGALIHYALARIDANRIALTDRGVALAMMANPVLDTAIEESAATLADDERAFFRDQVVRFAPGELRDLRTILSAIAAGHAAPAELLQAVKHELPTEWSEVMLRTHVSGAVARLFEMGLIHRRWNGRHVTYERTAISGF